MFVVAVFENNQVECVPLKWLEGQAKVYIRRIISGETLDSLISLFFIFALTVTPW